MSVYSNISAAATLMGHPARMSILFALLDGRALPAGELATMAGVTPQTASAHLSKLIDGNLVKVKKSGKHRYYQLADVKVAEAVEAVALISPPPEVNSLNESTEKKALYAGRTCYGHLAGEIGIKMTEALINMGYIEDLETGCLLTKEGVEWAQRFEVSVPRQSPQTMIPYHVDWTARKSHIAGPFALALAKRLLALGWIKKGTIHRSIEVTEKGKQGFKEEFLLDITLDD